MMRKELLDAIACAPQVQTREESFDLNDGPHAVRVATLEELGRLLLEVEAGLGWHLGSYRVPAILGHERQHARVGRQLGAAEVDFQVMFTRAATTVGPDGALNVAPSTRVQFRQPVPRLTQALIAAYPSCPSPGDIATIQQLGYTDIDQVAQYTQDMNRDFGVELPLPLWARLPN